MTIQFPCTGCGNQLSVPAEAAGKQARCPQCSTILEVPAASTAGGESPLEPPAAESAAQDEYQMRPPETKSVFDDAAAGEQGYITQPVPKSSSYDQGAYGSNPYASPTMGYDEPTAKKHAGGVQSGLIEFGDVFSHSWNLYMQNVGIVLGAVVLAWFIQAVLNFILSTLQDLIPVVLGQNEVAVVAIIAFGIFNWFAQIAISTFFNIGIWRIMLDVARGRQQDFAKLFSGADLFLPMFGATLLWLLMITPATFLLIIPGIIILLLFGQFHFLMVDQNMGIMESFGASMQITKNNWATLLGIYTVCLLIGIASMAVCFLPLIFFGPYISLMWAVMYLKMAGQHVAPA